MDRSEHVDSQLKPVIFSSSSIIDNSGSETDSSDESGIAEIINSNLSKSKKDKSTIQERSKHHKSRRSRSRSKNHHSRSRKRHSRNRSRSRSRSGRKDKRRNSSRSDHKRHRRKRSRSSKDNHSAKRSHKDSHRSRDGNNSRDPITRASRLDTNYDDADDRIRSRKSQYKRNEELAKKTEELTGIKIPSYLNATVLNPVKYAETEQKRKLLWSKKDDAKKLNILAWNASSVIASRGDDRKAAKFRKLMGIHDEPNLVNQSTTQDLSRKEHEQAELFSRLDADYQSARSQTHTSRGVGLGYNQSAYIDPSAYLAGRREEN